MPQSRLTPVPGWSGLPFGPGYHQQLPCSWWSWWSWCSGREGGHPVPPQCCWPLTPHLPRRAPALCRCRTAKPFSFSLVPNTRYSSSYILTWVYLWILGCDFIWQDVLSPRLSCRWHLSTLQPAFLSPLSSTHPPLSFIITSSFLSAVVISDLLPDYHLLITFKHGNLINHWYRLFLKECSIWLYHHRLHVTFYNPQAKHKDFSYQFLWLFSVRKEYWWKLVQCLKKCAGPTILPSDQMQIILCTYEHLPALFTPRNQKRLI